MMDANFSRLPIFAWFTTPLRPYNTLDDAQLETRCPLDNGRHSAGKLDQLPVELLIHILHQVDIPSLTEFRRVNRRAMELVDSLPYYNALFRHCPNIIRAIVSIQADSFDCSTLYRTLSTTQCSTCECFGNYLYLIDCHRVCHFCFISKEEFFPLTTQQLLASFESDPEKESKVATRRQILDEAKPPSVLSLPGRYCYGEGFKGSILVRGRIRLYDRRSVVRILAGINLPEYKTISEPQRFMAIITAPYLFDSGRRVDWGYFCNGCRMGGRDINIKYTKAGLLEHFERDGPVMPIASDAFRFSHVAPK